MPPQRLSCPHTTPGIRINTSEGKRQTSPVPYPWNDPQRRDQGTQEQKNGRLLPRAYMQGWDRSINLSEIVPTQLGVQVITERRVVLVFSQEGTFKSKLHGE